MIINMKFIFLIKIAIIDIFNNSKTYDISKFATNVCSVNQKIFFKINKKITERKIIKTL